MTKMCIDVEKGKEKMVREVLQALECVKVYDGYEQSEIINAQAIANNLAKYYGKYVRYTTPNGCNVKWRIFGSNGSNIYLIADDYVSKEYIPSGKKGSKIYDVYDNDYCLSFDHVINDYEDSGDIDERLRFLNSKYFEAIARKSSNNYPNIKAIAYMLDSKIWKDFVGEKAEYAIGGPTIEIMLNSHNKLNPANQIECYSSNIGYMIRRKGSIDWRFGLLNIFTDKVSYIEDTSKAYGMWVASPSAYGAYGVMGVDDYAGLNYGGCNDYGLGFRPLVSLKSNITLKELENGYEIK